MNSNGFLTGLLRYFNPKLCNKDKSPQSQKNVKKQTNFKIIKLLKRSPHNVVLIREQNEEQTLRVMKIFPYVNGTQSAAYLNEVRCASLHHPNIIRFIQKNDIKKTLQQGQEFLSSYVIYEYASHGSFNSIIKNTDFCKDPKLVRTYFRQLIQGLEYMHTFGLAHLDINLDNLLLGDDYRLKICDFDSSQCELGQLSVLSNGTENFRAPEIQGKKLADPAKSDVYSAGITLFAMLFGMLPYLENFMVRDHNLYELLLNDVDQFWDVHDEMESGTEHIDWDCKKLFESMVNIDPHKRASIDEIKLNKWYRDEVYEQEELPKVWNQILKKE